MKWAIALLSVGITIYALVDAYQDTKKRAAMAAAAAPLTATGGPS